MLEYPKTLEENLRFRVGLFLNGEKDRDTAGYIFEYVKRDILFFFNVFAWTYDTRTQIKDLPFITYGYQDKAILEIDRCIETGEDLFIDKSRDMGVTYLVLYVIFWRWLTKKKEQFKIGSRKEDYVDRLGDMDTLFEKLRYQIDRLPGWMLPIGFDRKKHSSFMRLLNPETSCAIIGEATNKDFARGGRPKAIFFDEFSAWEMAEEAWKAASDATRCKIPVGTPKGSGNKFAELARTNTIKNKLHLLWYINPAKAFTSEVYRYKLESEGRLAEDQSIAPVGCYVGIDGKIRSEWYDQECEKRTKDDIAENLDCNYLTSGRPYFDTVKCELKRIQSKPAIELGNLHWRVRPMFDENGYCHNQDQLVVEFVPNINGNVKLWEYPKDGWEDGYLIPADVAEGLEQGDYDSSYCLKRFGDKLEVVAALHGHMKQFEYVEELVKFAVFYHRAWLSVERNGNGMGVITPLVKLYNKLYHKEVMTKGYPQITDKIGFDTNRMTKPIICSHLSKLISTDGFECNDEEFWKETLTFVNNDGRLEAQGKTQGQKCFDDRVMSMAIGTWCHDNLPAPSRKKNVRPYAGWRKSWNRENENSLLSGMAV